LLRFGKIFRLESTAPLKAAASGHEEMVQSWEQDGRPGCGVVEV